MKKKDWTYIISILIIEAVLYGVSWLFADDVEYRIAMGVAFFLIWFVFSAVLVSVRLLTKRGNETLEIKLSRQGFNVQRRFQYSNDVGSNIILYVDFDSKQFASNILYNNVIPFSRIASGRLEILPYGITSNKSIVRYVISIRRKGDDNNFDYIEMFNTVVDNADLSDEEVTEQMIAKYPCLQDVVELHGVIQQIVEINRSAGIAVVEVDDDEWRRDPDSDGIDYDPNENSDPNYTKPPFSNVKW